LDTSAEARPLGLLDEHESESLDELELDLEDSSSLLELELLEEDSESDELLSESLDDLLLDDELPLEAAPSPLPSLSGDAARSAAPPFDDSESEPVLVIVFRSVAAPE